MTNQSTTTKEALEPWWTEFIERWNAKYPTTPLYDTESAKFYVRRAVKFILTNSIDGNDPTVWPSRVPAPTVAPDAHWQHVQIRAGSPRVVAIQFETPEQATAFINSFATALASTVAAEQSAPQRPYCTHCKGKGWFDGLEIPCRWCNPGGEFRALFTPSAAPASPVALRDEAERPRAIFDAGFAATTPPLYSS